MVKNDPTDIVVSDPYPTRNSCRITWNTPSGRYHIWADMTTLDFSNGISGRSQLYMNPLPENRGSNPGHFETKMFDGTAKVHAAMLVKVRAAVRIGRLVEKAREAHEAGITAMARVQTIRAYVAHLWNARMLLQPDPERPAGISELEVTAYSAALAYEIFRQRL